MITIELFRLRFPEFEDDMDYIDERIELFISDTVDFHMGSDELRWGSVAIYNLAQANLVAHLLTLATKTEMGDSSSESGPVLSKSAGGVSVSMANNYSSGSSLDILLSTTVYGQQFISIRNRVFIGVLVV